VSAGDLASGANPTSKLEGCRAKSPALSLLRKILPLFLLALVLVSSALRAESLAARVILLANSDDPDSVRIAEHYTELRGVPRENIIALPMPPTEIITWAQFLATVWQPLQDELVRRQWIDAIPMEAKDAVGRKQPVISGHRIAYLVVCRGVPLGIMHDAALYVLPLAPFDRAEFRTNAGAVDSELSLLAQMNYPVNGFVINPLFGNDRPSSLMINQVVKVARLDGPTVADALALVDNALATERTGLLGRAYVDVANKNREGDSWLESAARQLSALGFDLEVDRAPETFPLMARFDAPVLYFGWYAGDLNGPFTLPGFRFPPGAIAVHIHSASAATLRSDRKGWCGPLVARGVTATVGNVFEPYLGFLHRPDLLLRALARGETLGDAAYYAEPVLSWQAIVIGDPLYRPFARNFGEQWKNHATLPPSLAGYAALREMHLLEAQRKTAEAQTLAQAALRAQPNLALGLTLARQLEQAGDLAGVVRELSFTAHLPALQPDEWVLAGEVARLLQRTGAPGRSEQLYRRLLQEPGLPPALKVTWLREANAAAQAAGDTEQAVAWARELGRLDPDEKK